MHNQLISLIIGIPLLALFAGFLSFRFLPDWLVAGRVQGGKARYFIMSYLAFVMTIPVVYFGGNLIRENQLGPSFLVFLVAVPMAFLLKFVLLKASKIGFR